MDHKKQSEFSGQISKRTRLNKKLAKFLCVVCVGVVGDTWVRVSKKVEKINNTEKQAKISPFREAPEGRK